MKRIMVCLCILCMVGGLTGCGGNNGEVDKGMLGETGNFGQTVGLTRNETLGWVQGRFTINGEEIDLKGIALTVQGLLDLGFQAENQAGYEIIGAPKVITFTKNGISLEAAVISYEVCEFQEVKVYQIDSKGDMNSGLEVDGLKLGSTQRDVLDKFGEPFHKLEQGESTVWSYLADVDNSSQFQYQLDVSFQDQVVKCLSYTVGENYLVEF